MKVGTNVEVIVGTSRYKHSSSRYKRRSSRYKRTSSRYKCLLIGKQKKGKGLRSV